MKGKTIAVLGGGVGGLVAATELRRLVPPQHRIIVVEKDRQHAFAPSFLWLMTGDRRPAQITRDVRHLLRPGVELVEAEVRAIDLARSQVETSAQPVAYDYLVVALGAELAPTIIPGLGENTHTFYTLDGAGRTRDALRGFGGGTIAVVVSRLPFKCPAAPYEGAMLIADVLRRRKLSDRTEIHLFTPEPQPMPVGGPELGSAVRNMVEAKGIAFHPLHKLTAVEPQAQLLHFEEKAPIKYDLLVVVPPHRGPGLLRDAGLANEAGWIPVDRATLQTRHERVYALGDVTAVPIPGRWQPDVPLMLPKAGVFAHAQALVVARRIAGEITDTPVDATFCGDGYCMLEAGEDLAGFAYGNFFAEPSPQIRLHRIGRTWHLGKVLFEKWWLAPPGVRRELLHWSLSLGGKALGIPVVL